MEDVFSTILNHGKTCRKRKEYTTPSAKTTRRGKECAAFERFNTFYDSEGTDTGIHFSSFSHTPELSVFVKENTDRLKISP